MVSNSKIVISGIVITLMYCMASYGQTKDTEQIPAQQPEQSITTDTQELAEPIVNDDQSIASSDVVVSEQSTATENIDEPMMAEQAAATQKVDENQSATPVVTEQTTSSEPMTDVTVSTPEKEAIPTQEQPATEQPAPVAKQPAPVPAEEDEIIGIDTVDLDEPQGNWLLKRIWWERAEEKYEKLRSVVDGILESRMSFFSKRSELDKDVLDPFYIKTGLKQGELQELITTLINQLQQERAQEGVLDEAERDLLAALEQERATLEQLQTDVQEINTLDNEVDDALTKLMEQINRVRNYEQEAWRSFKEIARVLNDKQARELAYKVDAAWRNVKDLQRYIQQEFTTYFDQIIAKITQQIERVTGTIDLLKTKGIDFKQQAHRLLKQDVDEEHQRERERVRQELEKEQATQAALERGGLLQNWIINPILYVGYGVKVLWDYTIAIVRWPFVKLFGGGEQPGPTSEPEQIIEQSVIVPKQSESKLTQEKSEK